MISIKISEAVSGDYFMSAMKNLIQRGTESIELTINTSSNKELVISRNADEKEKQPLSLNDFFHQVAKQQLSVQIILNLSELDLEMLSVALVEKWGLSAQVKYTGQLDPTYFSLWDRPRIYYNVEHCLANYYQLETVKTAHLDVIHYFMRNRKVRTLRMHEQGLTDEVLCWAIENEIGLSVYGVDSMNKAVALLNQGVDYISTTD